jgi:hypothetical protein
MRRRIVRLLCVSAVVLVGGFETQLTTESTSSTTGSVVAAGGLGVSKNMYVGGGDMKVEQHTASSVATVDIVGTTGNTYAYAEIKVIKRTLPHHLFIYLIAGLHSNHQLTDKASSPEKAWAISHRQDAR